MPKFTNFEKGLVKSLVATLSLRLPDNEIIAEVEKQTGKSISRTSLYSIRKAIKKDSYEWYQELRQGSYEYIHQFKERINEIRDLQRQHHKIIQDNEDNPSVVQTSLAELHKLNVTLSNYFDVAPSIGNVTIPTTPPEHKATTTEQRSKFIV